MFIIMKLIFPQLNKGDIIKQGENDYIYELRGYIRHLGNEKSGHNYSICKNMFDAEWYSYNDNTCEPIKELQLDKTFFLCYIKSEKEVEKIEENMKYLNTIIDILSEN